jgi:hypothetical protein
MSDDPIVFKCEASLWDMLADEGVTGIPAKPFDMRRYDRADDRIERLCWGTTSQGRQVITDLERVALIPRQSARRVTLWEPDVPTIGFENKATGDILVRRYLGMEFTDWAPGWCFLLLGARVLDSQPSAKELKA